MMTLQQAHDWLISGGISARLVGDGSLHFNRVHTDTRTLLPGDLFVALKGEHFDANGFLLQAQRQGAIGAMAHQGLADAGLAGLEVNDSKLALGQLAAGWRSQFALPLIAVTGSNGKTTVTQMIASILRAWKQDHAFATEGNFNNDIGVPLTLLRLSAAHQVGVVELGMNHPGEIAYLAGLTMPAVALVNNAQREHLEFMATVEAVAHENGSVINALGSQGIAVFPIDDAYSSVWRRLAGKRQVLTFAESSAKKSAADITALAQWVENGWQVRATTPIGLVEFELQVAGRHNIKNALAATACALAVGVPLNSIAAGLSAFRSIKGRSRAVTVNFHGRLVTLIDDTYNANPDSMRAAIDVLAELPGPHLLVMGDMGEVGDQGPQMHDEAGRYTHASGIEKFFTLGTQSEQAAKAFGPGRHFESLVELVGAVVAELPDSGSVLVKGSRFMKMEQVVKAIIASSQKQLEEDTSDAA